MDDCLIHNPSTGDVYREISCIYPILAPLYPVKAELGYDPFPTLQVLKSMPWAPWVAAAVYGFAIFWGQRFMKNRERFNWRTAMALWNLGLAVFSFIGTIRLLPYALHIFANKSLQDVFCHDARTTFAGGSTGLWVQLFTISKFPELIDTFFIVIHKKKLIFLHWYHHMSVVVMCWHSYISEQPCGIHYCLMNYSVHSVMYFYYFLMTIKKNPKWFNPIIITFLQIAQMFIGIALTIAGFYYWNTSSSCNLVPDQMFIVSFVYATYFFLFVRFFVKRYFVKVKTTKRI